MSAVHRGDLSALSTQKGMATRKTQPAGQSPCETLWSGYLWLHLPGQQALTANEVHRRAPVSNPPGFWATSASERDNTSQFFFTFLLPPCFLETDFGRHTQL